LEEKLSKIPLNAGLDFTKFRAFMDWGTIWEYCITHKRLFCCFKLFQYI